MNKSGTHFLILKAAAAALASLLLLACAERKPVPAPPPQKADYTADARKWADSVANTMSDSELIGQLVMPAMYADSSAANLKKLRYYTDSLHLGGILLLKGDTASAKYLARTLRVSSKAKPFVAIDAEWGLGMRFSQMPSYTPFGRLPDSISEVNLYDYGFEIGRQAPQVGINVVFAPVLDVVNGLRSVIGYRSFGKDPQRVADLGTAFARGLEDGGVISVAKHFPGLGSAGVDSHRSQPIVTRSRNLLDSIDLYPFRQFIKMQLSGIMVGHVAMTALDTVVRSAAVSPMVINGLLRGEMKFQGIIFTDAFNMRGLGTVNKPILKAILAGADIIVAPTNTDKAVSELRAALADGTLSRHILLDRVRRILFFKYSVA